MHGSSGVGFYLKGELYSNNSVISITDIGVGHNALHCITDRQNCCRASDGGANGTWFSSNGIETVGNGRTSIADFSRSRRPSAVLLNRRNAATGPTGLYRCEVLDSEGDLQLVYIGVYGGTGGG